VRARRSARAGGGVGGVARSRGDCEAIFRSPSFVPPLPGLGSTRESSTPPTPTPRTGGALCSHVERLSQHATPMQDGVDDFVLVFSKSFFNPLYPT
jgi:hypothetical protein